MPRRQGFGLPPRLEAKIRRRSNGCWDWTASLRGGYGQVRVGQRVRGAHVVVWELLRGPVADGLDLDHLCRRPRCVNPEHLEPVARRVNVLRGVGVTAENARKTKCKHGHDLPPRQTDGAARSCRACRTDRPRKAAGDRRRRNAAAA